MAVLCFKEGIYMKKIGIIGFGAFGKLLADLLSPHATLVVFDKNNQEVIPEHIRATTISEVATAHIIIIATDISGIEEACQQLVPHVSPESIVMDVCSVKEKPQEILQQILGNTCLTLATHPLFGPQSVAENGGVQGLQMVVCAPKEEVPAAIHDLFTKTLGIVILPMTAKDHDKEMAWVHGLTFFVGRALMNTQPPDSPLATPYYEKLLALVELEKNHSAALFNTIQQGNRYARDVRKQFIANINTLERTITKGEDNEPDRKSPRNS